MTKKIYPLILLLLISAVSPAKNIDLGDKSLDIPSPEGFVLVDKSMPELYRYTEQLSDPVNDTLGFYVSEQDAGAAKKGELGDILKSFALKVNKELRNRPLSPEEFGRLKDVTSRNNTEIFEEIKKRSAEHMQSTNQNMSSEYEVDFSLQLGDMVPLPSHHSSEQVLSYSSKMVMNIDVNGTTEQLDMVVTLTFAHVKGFVLFLYCYAPRTELAWTRTASQQWVDDIIANNQESKLTKLTAREEPETRATRIDWGRVVERGLVGAVIGGIVGLVVHMFLRKKK